MINFINQHKANTHNIVKRHVLLQAGH